MNNTTTQHWGGGFPDADGIYPSQYLLGRRFMMPFPGGSKNAIAVDSSQEIYIISLYTIIVTAIFATWWILIVIAIPCVVPEYLLAQTSAHLFTHWAINEPSQTAVIMLQYWWRLLTSRLVKRSANSSIPRSNSKGIPEYLTFSWRDFTVTLIIVFLAAGTYVGGIVAGILLPNKFILGHAAPANSYTLHYPLPLSKFDVIPNTIMRNYGDYIRGSQLRALGTVDSGSARKLLNTTVKFEKIPSQPPSDWQSVDSYTIEYVLSVSGHDMGLQHAPDLAVQLEGKCQFMFEWNVIVHKNKNNFVQWVQWILWPNDNIIRNNITVLPAVLRDQVEHSSNTYQYVIIPQMWGIRTYGNNTDPWYHGDPFYPVKPGPPVVQCWENQTWTYKGWTGTLTDIQNNTVPNLHLSNAIITILKTHFSEHVIKLGNQVLYLPASPLGKIAVVVGPYALASMRTMGADNVVNLPLCSAAADMQRLAYGAYIMTRDLFRTTAIDYGLWMDSPDFTDDIRNNASLNELRMKDGQPLPGAGDFVIYTDRATAIRFETLVALPAVLVFSLLLVPVCRWLVRRKHTKKPQEVDGTHPLLEKEA
ncbi:hypothetical protein BDZ91DRAFT_833237 [Kalaharituber pfeilii]|nr:hypothetical protein BDZ91DRAFT_833237 [Kalaharituber pfeilii]